MRALLVTRCGCSKIVEVPDPPMPYFKVVLGDPEPAAVFYEKGTLPRSYETRTFLLMTTSAGTAIYQEEHTP